MSRLVDADELKLELEWLAEYDTPVYHSVVSTIDEIATVDAVEVTRCKDCKWFDNDGWGYGNCCRRNVDYLRMSDNGFCSFGERREDGKTD